MSQDPLVNHGFPHSHCNFGASLSGHIPVIVWSHNKNVGMLRYASMPQISVTGNRRFWPEIFATEPGLWAPKWDPIVSAPMASGTILWERKFWLFGLVDIEGFSSNLTWAMAKHFEWCFVIYFGLQSPIDQPLSHQDFNLHPQFCWSYSRLL